MRYIPNTITAIRLLLAVPFVICFLNGLFLAALVLYIITEILDQADGKVAVAFNVTSETGKFFDPFVDSTVHLSAFLCLFTQGLFPVWIMILFVFRELGLMFLRLIGLLVESPVGSSYAGKLKSLIYVISISWILWTLNSGNSHYVDTIKWFIFVSLAAAILSGIFYIVKFRTVLKKAFL